jgi:hypothetical protein
VEVKVEKPEPVKVKVEAPAVEAKVDKPVTEVKIEAAAPVDAKPMMASALDDIVHAIAVEKDTNEEIAKVDVKHSIPVEDKKEETAKVDVKHSIAVEAEPNDTVTGELKLEVKATPASKSTSDAAPAEHAEAAPTIAAKAD